MSASRNDASAEGDDRTNSFRRRHRHRQRQQHSFERKTGRQTDKQAKQAKLKLVREKVLGPKVKTSLSEQQIHTFTADTYIHYTYTLI